MFSTNGVEDVHLDQIHKGQQSRFWIGKENDWFGEPMATFTLIISPRHPISDGSSWGPQVVRGFSNAVRRHFTNIKVLMQGWIPLYHSAHYIALRRARVKQKPTFDILCDKPLMPTRKLKLHRPGSSQRSFAASTIRGWGRSIATRAAMTSSLSFETKGYDPLEEVNRAAAVKADGCMGVGPIE